MKYDAGKRTFMWAARKYRDFRLRAVGSKGNVVAEESTTYRRTMRTRWGKVITFTSYKVQGAYARSEAIFKPRRGAASGGGTPPARTRAPQAAPPPAPLRQTKTATSGTGQVAITAISHVEVDARAVAIAVERAARNVFGRLGALIKGIAVSSLRLAPYTEHAPAGEPPLVHQAAGGLRDIHHSTNRATLSLLVGPLAGASNGAVPERLEYGLGMEPRPFMGPAYQAVAPAFPAMWANSVHA